MIENSRKPAIVYSVPGPWPNEFTWTKANRHRSNILLLSLIGDVGHANSFRSQNNGSRDPLFSLAVVLYRINNTRYYVV